MLSSNSAPKSEELFSGTEIFGGNGAASANVQDLLKSYTLKLSLWHHYTIKPQWWNIWKD